jgi:AcrR family transcriptional regulator
MARKPGDRNRDFEDKRERLLDALDKRLRLPDAGRITLNEMAEAAGVSVSSLRHHLGTREQIVAAVLARQGRLGAPWLALVAGEPAHDLDASLRLTLHMMLKGLELGLGDLLANGLLLSLRDSTAGPAFLDALLEPILQSLEARLAAHARRGELVPCDVRVAALTLVAPLVLGALHQRGLCGDRVRPLDLSAMVEAQVSAFVRGYGATPAIAASAR